MPSAAGIHSQTFGAQIATRSPGSTPTATYAAAARRATRSSSAHDTTVSPSWIAGASPRVAAAWASSLGVVPNSMSARVTVPPR